MRSLTVSLVFLALACATPRSGDVAFVNMPVAVRDCRDGRVAREELMRSYRDYQERLDRRGQELKEEWSQIEESRARGENVDARRADFQRQMATVHDEYLRLQKDLSDAEQQRADQIRDRLKRVLRQAAQARGIETVSDSDAPLSDGRHYIDLTADVIRAAEAAP